METLKTLFAIALLSIPAYVCAQTPDVEAKIKSVPQVTYPAEASKTRLEGKVTVVVDIDQTGKVTKVNEAFGPDWVCPNNNRADVVAVRQIAQKAAETAVFSPAMKDKRPVTSQMRFTFDFKNPSPKQPTESPKKRTEEGQSTTGYKRVGNIPSDDFLRSEPLPSTATTETKTISGGVLRGSISMPKPTYPAAARALKAEGAVQVQVLIDTNGTIFRAEPISGHPLLRASARDAACKARTFPTLLSGEPVMVSGVLTYNFGGR